MTTADSAILKFQIALAWDAIARGENVAQNQRWLDEHKPEQAKESDSVPHE